MDRSAELNKREKLFYRTCRMYGNPINRCKAGDIVLGTGITIKIGHFMESATIIDIDSQKIILKVLRRFYISDSGTIRSSMASRSDDILTPVDKCQFNLSIFDRLILAGGGSKAAALSLLSE